MDPRPDPSWHMEENTSLENMAYLVSLFVDQIPRNLGATWSQIIKRDVMRPERFQISSLTSQEMQCLRSEYLNSDLNKVTNTCIDEENDGEVVSTCMSSLVSNHFPLPHVPVIINQLANRNLLIEKAMVDTGSQISIANYDYVKRHRFIDSSRIRPMLHNCSLKSATGCLGCFLAPVTFASYPLQILRLPTMMVDSGTKALTTH